ncbi:homoserine dehydrogenase [Cellulomonas fimi]|uniref:Homoserine dehydrogenase n=1 Tax=Cellulomonas fimi (strain ATCC 484 / DSM 20113 / JCM 1341 / CCUG 24087 / LMG 16345 / NBRC 15513 / NCIMB 8980 / NCTC 7547 / NRS-133) TaxID=590998 RepID=F4H7Y1_CELFA|nr:homoserine dehydrogenase [Cellulomonas fimi]AEE46942.1 homoserine dehydrogenase [Cellulomonas fimi ATCC 484]NNH08192.1 homoserine dehydrogenase [Cellulomonas fimi]VEH34633.1 Homoserine dehydrogenase [Cellulomonas fimi]
MVLSPDPRPSLRVAVLGCGVVGTEVVRLLTTQADDLAARVGARLELVGVAVRDVDVERDPVVDRALLTADGTTLVEKADVVVEVMGGIEPARSLLLHAIEHGASVVTANKALLAQDGPTLYAAADAAGTDLYFEAAVAGAIPIVRPVRESLAGDHVRRVLGIVNGTTNYVLDRMTTEGLDLDQAVKEAQALGYAEADPTADVEGYDAAAKAAILASLAFHTRVGLDDVHREGITAVTADDVAWAQRTGHVIKLLAIAERGEDADGTSGVQVRVHPALIRADHPLAGVRGAFNAVFVEAEAAGELMFYGRGAGGVPTASAVLGDVVSVARHRVLGGRGPVESSYAALPVLPAAAARTRYQVRLEVADRPGVLAQVASALAEHDVSIEAVRQSPDGDATADPAVAHLVITTHTAPDASLRATVEAVAGLDVVRSIVSVLRVEGA